MKEKEIYIGKEFRDSSGIAIREGDTVRYQRYREYQAVDVNGKLYLFNGERKELRPPEDFDPDALDVIRRNK